VLLVYFAYGASQCGKNAPMGTQEPPPVTRLIAEEKSPVIRIHEPAEQYYAVITEEIIEEEVIP
jgi:hypothetical protein